VVRATEVLGSGIALLGEKNVKSISFKNLPQEIFASLSTVEFKTKLIRLPSENDKPEVSEMMTELQAGTFSLPSLKHSLTKQFVVPLPGSLRSDLMKAYDGILEGSELGTDMVVFYLADRQTLAAHRREYPHVY